MPADFLVSAAARERWMRWKKDLQDAENYEQNATDSQNSRWGPNNGSNNSTAFSPPTSPAQRSTPAQLSTPRRSLQVSAGDTSSPKSIGSHEQQSAKLSMLLIPRSYSQTSLNAINPKWEDSQRAEADDNSQWTAKRRKMDGDGSQDESNSHRPEIHFFKETSSLIEGSEENREDNITDTVGAIAVDCRGNIAAGSSSGGIGMKHRGRCGPAALVGVGTAVKPMDPNDPDQVCVATVISGTGEHMATTMAAATVADRIYHSVRKNNSTNHQSEEDQEEPRIPGLENCDENEAMRAMIKEEFMKHPGVKSSHCAGAIGIMAVKKTKHGIYFYFGHNTDSFALASLHNEEKRTTCVMSRSNGNGSIAQGGRAIHRNRFAKH
jgi:taspase, threonine aspartase, 1